MAVLVVAAHDGKTVRSNVANAVTAALQMGPDVHVLVAGSNAGEAAKSAAATEGVAKVLDAEDAAYANWLAEDVAPLVVKLAPAYSHVVMAADSVGKNLAPRVAALLDVAQVSEAIKVVSPDTFVRPIYAGNAMATVQTADKIKVVTIRPTNFKATAGGGSAPIEQIGGEGAKGLSSYVGAELSKSERPELTSAKIVVSGGRGLQSGENFKMLETLADKLGAGLGARPLYRHRHLRRDPASRRHEGQQDHRRDQQGRGSADLPGGRLRHRGRSLPDRAGADRRGRKEISQGSRS